MHILQSNLIRGQHPQTTARKGTSQKVICPVTVPQIAGSRSDLIRSETNDFDRVALNASRGNSRRFQQVKAIRTSETFACVSHAFAADALSDPHLDLHLVLSLSRLHAVVVAVVGHSKVHAVAGEEDSLGGVGLRGQDQTGNGYQTLERIEGSSAG